MEYAEGGSLAQLIQKHAINGKRFSEDMIFMYSAQMTLSLMALHSKNILHRDIKTQNLFIKKGILKLGDFGISKALEGGDSLAQTMCGTPYFMPPEVCRGEKYDSKADVWAMGVIIYELVTLKKPFDGDNLSGLFEKIKSKDLEPIPEDSSQEMKLLIGMLLNKEKDKRPNIFEVAKIKSIRNKILQFVSE